MLLENRGVLPLQTKTAAVTRGVQQEEGFYVTVKHFAANNQEDNRNQVSSELTERALREIYLRPFEIAVKKGRIPEEALRRCCANVVKSIFDSAIQREYLNS